MRNSDETLPKYLRIAGHIRRQIERGELISGAEVPSERDLAAQWAVARPTAAKALNTLRQQGIVKSRRGAGTYVAERRLPQLRAGELRDDHVASFGWTAGMQPVAVLDVGRRGCPAHLVETFGSGRVWFRSQLVGAHTEPAALLNSWFPVAIADTALREPVVSADNAGYVETATGRYVDRAITRVCARLATAPERRVLELPRPAAVLVRQLVLRDDDETVVRVDEMIGPPDSWLLEREYSGRR